MEILSEQERYEAGAIPHDLVLPIGEIAVREFEFKQDESEKS